MLRRTVRKAFRQPEGEGSERAPIAAPPAAASGRRSALDRLFEDLRLALLSRLAAVAREPGNQEGGPFLSSPRARPAGLDLFLGGTRGTLRFRHTMEGWIRVDALGLALPAPDLVLDPEDAVRRAALESLASSEGWEPFELVAVHPRAGAYRPLRRPAVGRRPFQYTSVTEMARDYLRVVE